MGTASNRTSRIVGDVRELSVDGNARLDAVSLSGGIRHRCVNRYIVEAPGCHGWRSTSRMRSTINDTRGWAGHVAKIWGGKAIDWRGRVTAFGNVHVAVRNVIEPQSCSSSLQTLHRGSADRISV